MANVFPCPKRTPQLRDRCGAPIARHDAEWGMVYSSNPPYEILQNKLIDFATMQRIRRFARFWDLVGNSGNFVEGAPLLWGGRPPFDGFLEFVDWAFERVGRTHSIALSRLAEWMHEFLCERRGWEPSAAAEVLANDLRRAGHKERPSFQREGAKTTSSTSSSVRPAASRQARHLAR